MGWENAIYEFPENRGPPPIYWICVYLFFILQNENFSN